MSDRQLNDIRHLLHSISTQVDRIEEEKASDVGLSESSEIIYALSTKLASLVLTPRKWVIRTAWSYTTSVALALVLELRLEHHIRNDPQGTTLCELGQRTNADKQVIKIALSQCVQAHIFEEPAPGHYLHNANSLQLLDEGYAAWVLFRVDESYRAAAYLPQSLRDNNWQVSEQPARQAFGLAFQTDKPLYEWYSATDRHRGSRFDIAMAASLTNATYGVQVEELYDFSSLPSHSKVVDVGGGRGQNSIRLARRFPELEFVVQDFYCDLKILDLESMEQHVTERIQWQKHDFCAPQTIRGAEIYLLSQVLLDHQRGKCIEILSHISAAMGPSSTLLIVDWMSPDENEGYLSPQCTALNLHMLSILGRVFWTRKEWQELFATLSPRLDVRKVEFRGGRVLFVLGREV